jgi:hypothetical protein
MFFFTLTLCDVKFLVAQFYNKILLFQIISTTTMSIVYWNEGQVYSVLYTGEFIIIVYHAYILKTYFVGLVIKRFQ